MNLGEVLFATDFSTASERAGIVAKGLAQQWGNRFHIVHVVHPLANPGDSADRLKRLVAEADERLRVETALLSGRVAHQIMCYARDKRIGLIVLGTHGRTGVSHALLGSVAESVVRLAPCPVLTVSATAGEAGNLVPAAEPTASHRCIVCGGQNGGSDLRDMPDAHSRRGARAETGRGTSWSPRRARVTPEGGECHVQACPDSY